MTSRYMIEGINKILDDNRIPWKFNREQMTDDIETEEEKGIFGRIGQLGNAGIDTPDAKRIVGGRISGAKGIIESGMYEVPGINCFPGALSGDLYNDFVGFCGLDSGNESLISTFKALQDWAKQHIYAGSRKPLTAVIFTDKWNSGDCTKYFDNLKELDIRLVIILVTDYVQQLPYNYTNIKIADFLNELPSMNDGQREAIRHAARIMMYAEHARDLADLDNHEWGIGSMVRNRFRGIDVRSLLKELHNYLY